jgi:long-subunit acyl-CoA synthetase (AMP-forming)
MTCHTPGESESPGAHERVSANDNRLCLKGANIVPGYLHDMENTAKLLDKDGWLHTGE